MLKSFLQVAALLTLPWLALGQNTGTFQQEDIKDWFVQKGWIKKKPEKNNFLLIIPVGRFRGEDLLYGETEYRFPISTGTGILGGVLFVNSKSATNNALRISLFDYLQPAYGTGLRVMLDKKSRTRLEMDVGIAHQSLGFYFGAQETF